MALFMFIGVLVSLGFGPYIVAFISEDLYPGDAGLGKAMTLLTCVVVPPYVALLLSQLKTKREIAEASLEQIASNAFGKATITPQKVSAFTELMRDKLRNGDVRARKDWLGAVLERIEVGDDVVKIVGNKQVLAAAVTGQNTAPPNVRGFVRKWRARRDSNPWPPD